VIDAERARSAHGHFNVIHTESAMRADVYLAGTDALQSWALAHHVVHEIQGELVRFAPIEYVIVYKLRFSQMGGSERHLFDIARMLEVSADTLDRGTLNQWIADLGLADVWVRTQSFVNRT
jgi:hypothetical protein